MVEENFNEAVEDDTSLDDFVEEEEDESEEEALPEEELEIPDEEPEEEEAEEPEEPQPKSEPGWIKQRVQKAVDKAVAQALAAQQEQFNKQMAPIIAKMQEDEAQELVTSRKVNDIKIARELVSLRRGQAATEPPVTEQPRNEQGQFVSKEQIANNAKIEAKVDMLAKQAKKIKANGGPDVMELFDKDPEIRQKVSDGEMDFYDVADMMKKSKKKPPTPSRSPNGASNITANAFANMSSKQFERMERKLEEGVRYTMR